MDFLEQVNWRLLLEITYLIIIILTSVRVILDTDSVQKTMSYLLLVIFLPVAGIIIYFSIGINYRKRKIYNKKLEIDEKRLLTLIHNVKKTNREYIDSEQKKNSVAAQTMKLLTNPLVSNTPIFNNNRADLLINGETLFPDILEEIRKARHHIHLEYYIFENDRIGNAIKEALIEKAEEGVEVRFIYDDFGSSRIRRNIVRQLNRHKHIEAYAFHKIRLIFLANRLNYRNHRKIIIIDGLVGYTGGINVSDKYINSADENKLYWRDTHVKLSGSSVSGLQHVFLSDWNFCSGQHIGIDEKYFPDNVAGSPGQSTVQIISSGPDSDMPTILYAYIQAINSAQEEILLTTPYYIPDAGLQQVLVLAALRGVRVKLLLPGVSDSRLVSWASQAYYDELLRSGVDIYLYKKGFIHAKTMVIDSQYCAVGTANLDSRSFDLNFEVSSMIYDAEVARQLTENFYKDLADSESILYRKWRKRSLAGQFIDKVIRLLSPLL